MRKWKIFHKILKQTEMDRILIFFSIFIALVAFILEIVEPSIKTYSDAIWYCFETFTTVGYGDFSVNTNLGRFISIILMLVGILIVSLFTGTLVNFYNEITKNKNNEVINEFMDKLENLENLSKDELRDISKKVTQLRNKR